MVYRAKIFFDNDPANVFEYVGQIEPSVNVTPRPTIRIITMPPTIRVITPTKPVITPTPTRVIIPTRVTPSATRGVTPTRVTPSVTRVITPTGRITPTMRRVTPTVTRKPTPTKIYGKNVCGHNGTGKTANDLEIYLKGKVNVLDYWNRNIFQSISYYYDQTTDTTVVRFYNGTAPHCAYIHSCIFLDQPPVEVRQRTWTIDGVPIAPIGAAVSSNYQAVRPGVIDLTIGNYAQDGGPLTITEFQYGPGKRVYRLEEMVWDNPAIDAEIPWSAPQRFHLNLGETLTLPGLTAPPPAVVMVYRYKAYLDSDPANVMEYYEEVGPIPGYVVNYAIQSDWGTGATVSVTITNNTPTAVNGWNLVWNFPGAQTITNLWNATYAQSGSSVSVKNAAFNAVIPANGGSVNFGLNLNYTGTNPKPTSFTLNGIPCLIE
ncbi:MAG TPA: cellulose-binding domain-containing protein [Bacillota bacterium]|nr:cellulose-binding domain-containing protein [Bacillota bacterium]